MSASEPTNDLFAVTRWSLVQAAGKRHSPDSDQALNELCKLYWFPLYLYVRRRGFSKEEAEDITQSFLSELIERNPFTQLNAPQGKFRAFLLAAIQHFISNHRDRKQALKRGGNAEHFPIDWATADSQFQLTTPAPSEKAFDRAWAESLLERVLRRLEQESANAPEHFELLKSALSLSGEAIPYTELARKLSCREGTARVAVHRLRKRYRQLLREEVLQTIENPADLDSEIRALFDAFSNL